MTRPKDERGTGEAPSRQEEFITLESLLTFARRYALRILLTTVAAGGLALLLLVLLARPRYESRATLMIAPTSLSRELSVSSPGARGHQRLAESEAVVHDTVEWLRGQGVLAATETLSVPGSLKTRVYTASGTGAASPAPILELVVWADDAEKAAKIGNAWTRELLDRLARVAEETVSRQILSLRRQHRRMEEEVEAVERLLREETDGYQSQLERTSERWQRRIAEHRRRTAEFVDDYQEETAELFRQLEADDGSHGAAGLVSLILRLRFLREELASTPRFLFLENAVTHPASWEDQVASDGEACTEGLTRAILYRKEPNAVYEALYLEAAELEALARAQAEAGGALQTLQQRLEEVQVRRTVGLTRLMEERITGLAALHREEARALRSLARERDRSLAALFVKLERRRELLDDVARDLPAEGLPEDFRHLVEVRPVSEAVAPTEPVPRRIGFRVGAAAFFGALLGLAWALVSDALRTRQDDSP